MKDALTVKQRRFVEAYTGNATAAAIEAGYSGKTAHSIGQENLTKPEIIVAIQARETVRTAPLIADREARQTFWSTTMNDHGAAMRDRLKASELLGKSEGDFLDNVNLRCAGPPEVTLILNHPAPASGTEEIDTQVDT